ncbi:hypothetical protein M9Y10_000766 [Tritrichomonas musculus]|uniref:Uncharacterized protein n=1 Tax=Tritrichomonas musculus TaxID=1915356 RepID=A0ABR2L542_9EUKA
MCNDCRFVKNKQFIKDMLQYTSEKTVKSLINSGDCGKIDFQDIKIDTTKIIYSLITHELYHIIIDIPYKTKKDNIFFCQLSIYLSISNDIISKNQLIDYFAESKGKINYEIVSMKYATLGIHNYFAKEINYDELIEKNKRQRLVYACNDPDQPYYLLGLTDEDNLYFNSISDDYESA